MEPTTPTPEFAVVLPARRADLVIRPMSDAGECVVKDPVGGGYFNLGAQEGFLLAQLDGRLSPDDIRAAFQNKFHEALGLDDLNEFINVARTQGFLAKDPAHTQADAAPAPVAGAEATAVTKAKFGQSLLFFRKSIFDPDRVLTWLEPKVRFLWTRGFLLATLAGFVMALAILIANWDDLLAFLPRSYEMLILAWFAIALATACHEFAHGLTCKHYGGDVHDMGFLLMFFLPCFYCDVSDAWLMRERAKRLWVTLAGTYCDMCLWTLAVFIWRLTLPGTTAHNLALLLITVCGVRMIFNFNPLLKLDGYYMLGDALEVPNLRPRALASFMGHVRWLFWGAARPVPEPCGRFLLIFGAAVWCFSVMFLALMLLAMLHYLGTSWGILGIGAVAFLAYHTVPGLFQGFTSGEVMKMLQVRPVRAGVWLALIVGGVCFLTLFRVQDRATGNFKVRPTTRAELRAPVSGFLQVVYGEEGVAVSAGAQVASLEIPDLASRLTQKKAELAETRAKLRLLEAGPRPEEVHEQREKVARAKTWRELAVQDLNRKRQALEEEVVRLTELIRQHQIELDAAQESLAQARRLAEHKALALELLREADRRFQVAQAQLKQAQAQKRERVVLGLNEAEAELGRREKDLADAQASLKLLLLGTRTEEVDAQKAHLARLQEETDYLDKLQDKVRVVSPIAGVIATPRLREKVGQYLKEGDLICEIEDPNGQEVEVVLQEQEVSRVLPGSTVELKARALPFHTFTGNVERLAPVAVKEKHEPQSMVTVHCRIDAAEGLRPGMSGFARIECGQRSLGAVWGTRVARYLRTEFWW